MASGKLSPTHTILSGNISSSSQQSLKGAAAGSGGTADHNRLTNRDKANQHPIEAITGLRKELDSKLDSNTALPLIEEAVKNKAKVLVCHLRSRLLSIFSHEHTTSESANSLLVNYIFI